MAQDDRFQGRVTAIEGIDGAGSEIEFSLRLPEGRTQRVRAPRALAAIKEDDLVVVRGRADPQGIVIAQSITQTSETGRGRRRLVAIAAAVVIVALAVAVTLLKSTRGVLPEAVAAGQRVAIVNVNSNLCATVAGGNTLNNTQAVQFPCDEDLSRFWTFAIVEGSDVVQIKNVNSGLCLAIADANTDGNAPSVQDPCDSDPSRRWRIRRVDDQTFRSVNVNSNLCLAVAGGGRDRNTTLVQYPCDGDPSRDWRLRVSP